MGFTISVSTTAVCTPPPPPSYYYNYRAIAGAVPSSVGAVDVFFLPPHWLPPRSLPRFLGATGDLNTSAPTCPRRIGGEASRKRRDYSTTLPISDPMSGAC